MADENEQTNPYEASAQAPKAPVTESGSSSDDENLKWYEGISDTSGLCC